MTNGKDAMIYTVAILGYGFAASWVLASIFKFFVALKEPPVKRAMWTVGLGYILSTIPILFLPLSGWQYLAPLVNAPGALGAFWFWRREFRENWVDDVSDLPEGVVLENDDWRIGLLLLGAAVSMVLLKAVTGYFWRHFG